MSVTPSDAPGVGDEDLVVPTDPDPRPPAPDGTGPAGRARARARRGWPAWSVTELRDDGPVPVALMAAVVLVVAAGVVLRFVTRSHLWLDEALSASIAALAPGDLLEALRHDGHPPLYYLALHVWQGLVGTGDVAVRSLSGVASVLTLPLAYVAGRRSGGRLLGLLTLGAFALSPFLLRYATEARMYALVSLQVLAGYLLIDDVVRRGRGGAARLAGLAAVTAALLWSHYWAMWLGAATAVVLAWTWRRSSDPAARRAGARALLALIAGVVAFVPWLGSMLYQSAHTGTPWAGPMRPSAVVAVSLTDLGGGAIGGYAEPPLFGAVLLLLVALGLFGTARGGWHIDLDLRTTPQFRAEAAVVAITLALATVVMFATRSTFASRYISVITPLVLLIAAGGLSRLRDPRALAAVGTVLLGLSAVGAVFNVKTDRTQAAVNVANLARTGRPGDIVVYCPDQLAPAALRLMPPGFEHLAFPHLPGDPWPADRVDWSDYVARNSIDPRAYARSVAEHARGRGVFVLYSGEYTTHEGTCGWMVEELTRVLGPSEMLAVPDGSQYFESSALVYFPPRPA